ncbi:MAG: hypothetical protein B7Y43_07195 [Sphingomonas sp. 28-62-20]|uniref:DUF819 family protein n=1 Tax=Sphingomonas sp. 28-62-20 TaxID=1970433 RepID=UPI000BD74AF0|nr:MAG: hypothetical protein B7Y43_07195 [Sphingomonas sp. 28-62-20]
MSLPLIAPNDVLGLLAAMMSLIALCQLLERSRFGHYLPAPMTVLLFAMLLSNIGVLPTGGPVHDVAIKFIVPLALPLLLFKANLRQVVRGIDSLLLPFVLATLATVAATLIAFLLVPLGPEGPAFAATNAAGLLGGSVNYVAVSRAENLSATGFAIGSAAFVVLFVPYLVILQWLPRQPWILRRFGPSRVLDMPGQDAPPPDATPDKQPADASAEAGPLGLVVTLALAAAIAAVGARFSTAIGHSEYALLTITAVALALANIAPAPLARIRGETSIAMYILMIYFAFMGSTADASVLIAQAGPLTWFIALIVILHLAFLLVAGWLLRLPLVELLLASNATVGGPATAAAYAETVGATALVTPAVLTGILGYATATFVSLALANLLRVIG